MPAYEYVLRYAEPATPSTFRYIGGSRSRMSLPGDTPANTWVPGNLSGGINYAVSLFDGIDPTPTSRSGVGAIVLRDRSVELDLLAFGLVWDGGVLEVLRGTPGADLSTFSTVGVFTTAGILQDHDSKEIRLRDLGWLLENPLHEDRYGGTGGADGDASLTDRLKPYCGGQVFNIPAQQLAPTGQIWQVSGTPVESIDAVRDGGVDIPRDTAVGTSGDFANYAALNAGTPAASKFATCKAEGLFKLGSTPLFPVTADVKGDKTGGTYVNKRGDIAKRIVSRSGTGIAAGSVDSTALTALNTAHSGACGFFWNGEITKQQALNEVMQGILGTWFINPTGNLVLGYHTGQDVSGVKTYQANGDVVRNPSAKETFQSPRWKTTIGYQKNYFPQDRGRLATGLSEANYLLYGQDSQWSTYENASQRTYWPSSRVVQFDGGFVSSSDAAAEALRQSGLLQYLPQGTATPERYRVGLRCDPWELVGFMGQTIGIQGYTRQNWRSPRYFRLIGVELSSSGQIHTAILWGFNG